MHPYVGDPPEPVTFTDDQLHAVFSYERAEARCLLHGWHRALAKLPAERKWLEANRVLF